MSMRPDSSPPGVFDPVQLRSFLAVAQAGGFTSAARRLGVQQSTVSQHVRRLERAAGRQLFLRDTHSVELTPDGEAMLGFARGILAAHEQAAGYFAGTQVRGRLRVGVSEDFVLTELPQVLRTFRRAHPQVDLELTVGLSGILNQQLADGALDLVLGKRPAAPGGGPGDAPGSAGGSAPGHAPGGAGGGAGAGAPAGFSSRVVWRDRLVWVCAEDFVPDPDPGRPVPLIVYPPPSVTRARALEVLDRAGRPWRIACTSGSLSGVTAAALAGLGVVAHARGLVPAGLRSLPDRAGLPDLGQIDFVLTGGRVADREPARSLAAALLANGHRLHRGR